MPTVYRRRQRIPELKGRVRGGLAVVVRSPWDVGALGEIVDRSALLPGDPIDNLYRAVASAGASFDEWARLASLANQSDDGEESEESEERVGRREFEDPRVWALLESLDRAADLWKGQGDDINQLALALVVPRPGRKATLDSTRPALVLDYGSVRARVAGGRWEAARSSGWRSFRSRARGGQSKLVEALRDRATGTRLPRLETIKAPESLGQNRRRHLSTRADLDRRRHLRQIRRHARDDEAPGDSTLWCHGRTNTLDSIDLNAEVLSELIEQRLGAFGLPIAFVCHSRGGLVARRTVSRAPRNQSRALAAQASRLRHLRKPRTKGRSWLRAVTSSLGSYS
jgi:hypothetical protein